MTEAPARALLITRNLPPVIGGMERLIGHVAGVLSRHFAALVVGPHGGRMEAAPRRYLACPLSPAWLFLAVAAARTAWSARGFRPQLVFAGSGLTAPIAWLGARLARAPYAVYLHGLDIAVPHPLYRRLFVPAIRRARLVLANSRYTAGLAAAAGVPQERIRLLHPGVDLPALPPDHGHATRSFRERYRLPPGPILLGVGRLTPRKGFSGFVAESLPQIVRGMPDAQFVVAGEVPRHAAARTGNEAERIRRAAADAGVANHVHLIGPLDDAGLALAWPAADVHVFPVRDDPADPEGFGMVALEAAAWGIPSVAFASAGVTDAVADGLSGYLVPPGDYPAFAQRVRDAIDSRARLAPEARRFAADFAWPKFAERLDGMLDALLEQAPAREF